MKVDRHSTYEGIVRRLRSRDPGVSATTAEGMPTLALQGSFFAGFDPEDGSLVVRLPEQRITSLVIAGVGHEVAAAGRIQGDRVGIDDPVRWDGFADEALSFVGQFAA
ncbi:MAG: hypothetical protein Q8Q29_03840 [Actinomycetota bacterium]|nr:hypothetical protein [Actinomycetota bacterium]